MLPTWTQQVDQLYTSTWMYRQPAATEQAFLKTPLSLWLKEKGRVKELRGYTRIEIPLDYAPNEQVRWIGKGSTVPIGDDEHLTMAYEDWKYVAVSIVRFGTDDQKNRGKAKLLNLVESKLNNAERSLQEEFERAYFADGTGENEPNGFQNIIADTPTTGTLHGLNRATYPWFRNQTKASSGAASVYLVSDMRNLLNTCTKYSGTKTTDIVLITDQDSYELYEDETTDQRRLVNKTLGDADFEHVVYKGRPLWWSPSAPSGKMYFVNTQFLMLYVDPDYYMQMTEWKAIPDQVNDKVAQILCTQNLCSSRPVTLGVLTGISA